MIELSIDTEIGYLDVTVLYQCECVETYNGNSPDADGMQRQVTKIISVNNNGNNIKIGNDKALIELIEMSINN